MRSLETCDVKGCKRDWSHRINFLDMCELHYQLWKDNEKNEKKQEGIECI